ncbi:hypothetical protein BH24ACI4_BH24ACI4_11370 [soil metagenome]
MSEAAPPPVGTIVWRDLTVENAEAVREFYQKVVGWEASPVDQGGYSDFNMMAPGSDEAVAGVCHARGANASLPAQWLIYIIVEDVDFSAAECVRLGGEVVAGPRLMNGARFAVIKDPAGAVCAIFQPPRAA